MKPANLTKLNDNDVVELLHSGRRLMLMHTGGGDKSWFVVPGGRIAHDVAHAVIAREDVHGAPDDLWPGIPQVFKYRRVA